MLRHDVHRPMPRSTPPSSLRMIETLIGKPRIIAVQFLLRVQRPATIVHRDAARTYNPIGIQARFDDCHFRTRPNFLNSWFSSRIVRTSAEFLSASMRRKVIGSLRETGNKSTYS
jgi:hypothetical protein